MQNIFCSSSSLFLIFRPTIYNTFPELHELLLSNINVLNSIILHFPNTILVHILQLVTFRMHCDMTAERQE
jgi:hypothetical protein